MALMLEIFTGFAAIPWSRDFPISAKIAKILDKRLFFCFFILFLSLISQSCKISESNLTLFKTGDRAGPNCASCHEYPLLDTNHVFHLFEIDSIIYNDRPITCLHCHRGSIAGHDSSFADSIFRDVNGNEFGSLGYPDIQSIRNYPLVRIDTLVFLRPLFQPPRPGPPPEMRELQTSAKHLNGVVDVDFDETSIDTLEFSGRSAVYDPVEMTCSAVTCHPNDALYRWARPSKNIPMTNGDEPIE